MAGETRIELVSCLLITSLVAMSGFEPLTFPLDGAALPLSVHRATFKFDVDIVSESESSSDPGTGLITRIAPWRNVDFSKESSNDQFEN